jgi:hypothetical protein
MGTTRGAQVYDVDPKRSFERVALQVDWHDSLARLRSTGMRYSLGEIIRPRRSEASGFEYECVQAGVTGSRPVNWPYRDGATITDGSAIWLSRPLSDSSLRTIVQSAAWSATPAGLVLSAESVNDCVYTIYADEGVSGVTYEVKHSIALATPEELEAAIILRVQD